MILLFCGVAFGESVIILSEYYDNDKAQESLHPSFDCDKATLHIDVEICNGAHGEFGVEMKIIDNFYTSYYNAIMKNATKKQQSKIKQIARNLIKTKDDSCFYPEDAWATPYSGFMSGCITNLYMKAIQDITNYALKNNKTLLEYIFFERTDEIVNLINIVKYGEYIFEAPSSFLNKLYQYKMIDKTGKLIENLKY